MFVRSARLSGGTSNFILEGSLGAFENLVGPKKVPIRGLFPIHIGSIRVGGLHTIYCKIIHILFGQKKLSYLVIEKYRISIL